jgi:hypothetical protein
VLGLFLDIASDSRAIFFWAGSYFLFTGHDLRLWPSSIERSAWPMCLLWTSPTQQTRFPPAQLRGPTRCSTPRAPMAAAMRALRGVEGGLPFLPLISSFSAFRVFSLACFGFGFSLYLAEMPTSGVSLAGNCNAAVGRSKRMIHVH